MENKIVDYFSFFIKNIKTKIKKIYKKIKELNSKKYIIIIRWCLLTIFTILSLFFISKTIIKIKNIYLIDEDGEIKRINLPYTSFSSPEKKFKFIFIIKKQFFTPKYVKIIPDDGVLEIISNGEFLPLEIVDNSKLFNWDTGFEYPLGKYLKKGNNYIEIKIINKGGPFGLKIFNSSKDFKYSLFIFSFYLFFSLLLIDIFLVLKFKKTIVLTIVLTIITRLFYFSITQWEERGYDVKAHIEYIEYIVNNNKLPESDKGWEFHQPPLYYLSCAIIYKFLKLETFSIYKSLQLYSLFLDIIIILAGYLIITFYITKTKIKEEKLKNNLFFISFALFSLWPSHIIHSIRIGNDVMLYLFYLLSFLFFIYWLEKNKLLYFVLFNTTLLLGSITKKNAIVFIPIIYSVLILKFLTDKKRLNIWLYVKKLGFISIIIIIILTLTFYTSIEKKIKGIDFNPITGNTHRSLHSGLFVSNHAQNYLFFDLKEFLTTPFTNPWEDKGGRQFFLNYFLKTSLFAEFNYKNSISKNIGIILSFLLLIILICLIIGLLLLKKELYIKILPLIFNFIFLFFSTLFFRITIPASCHGDFRFAFPSLVSIVILYSLSLNEFHKRKLKKLFYLGFTSALFFIFFTLLFIFTLP